MRLLIFLVLFSTGTMCNGQKESVYTHDLLITYSPSALLNLFPGIQFGIEKFIAQDQTLELEVARLIPISFETTPAREDFRLEDNSRLENKDGLRVKLGYKKYITPKLIILGTVYYRKTYHDFEEWAFIEQGNFEQLIDYNSTKTLLGPTIGFGFSNGIKGSFYFETAVNIGLGAYTVERNDVNEDVIPRSIFGDLYHPSGNYAYPIIGLSFKIKYGL